MSIASSVTWSIRINIFNSFFCIKLGQCLHEFMLSFFLTFFTRAWFWFLFRHSLSILICYSFNELIGISSRVFYPDGTAVEDQPLQFHDPPLSPLSSSRQNKPLPQVSKVTTCYGHKHIITMAMVNVAMGVCSSLYQFTIIVLSVIGLKILCTDVKLHNFRVVLPLHGFEFCMF